MWRNPAFDANHDAQRKVDFATELAELTASGDIPATETPRVPREIDRAHVRVVARVGAGQFGEVHTCMLDETATGGVPEHTVIAKTVKEASGDGAKELLREAAVMAQVKPHRNVLPVVGVVTVGEPLMLLAPFCDHGSLLDFMRNPPAKITITLATKREFGRDVALGMRHLIQHRFVHRDLGQSAKLLRLAKKRRPGQAARLA